ncbi:MAG: L,D-transpeptidase [Candidatus Moraniibacteriota bacterium]|nr:MAG: L,D-transpeptidase [Candidatus Moranbacteria bacterium]
MYYSRKYTKYALGALLAIFVSISSFLARDALCDEHSQQKHEPKIIVDLNRFELKYYDNSGKLRLQSIATGGARWCNDINRSCQTPSGTYRIVRKYGDNYRSKSYPISCFQPCNKSGSCVRSRICGAKMPYYMELSEKYAFGIHGGFVPREPLAHVTHACIRIPWGKAREISQLAPEGTLVIVLPYMPNF